MGLRGMHIEFLWESQKKINHLEDLDLGGRILLKWILRETEWGGMDWIDLAQARE
jgi:hypothetical protein